MKKLLSVLMVLALIVSSVAFAADYLSLQKEEGDYADTNHTKNSPTGSDGSVTIRSNPNRHSMFYQIHKANGGAASEYKNKTTTGTYPLEYKSDGYGNSLGRQGYSYRLRVAHRSQCTCAGGAAKVEVDFTP